MFEPRFSFVGKVYAGGACRCEKGGNGVAMYALVWAFALAAGFVQGLTGFGAGIVLMVVLPLSFSVVQSAGLVLAICFPMSLSMLWRYRSRVRPALVWKPALLFTACSVAGVCFALRVDQTLLKLVFGVFLVLLALYFLIFQKGGRAQLSTPVSILCIVASGLCDGLFGIGGPLMVVYYLSRIEDIREYLGTIQAFFCACDVAMLVFRVQQGIIVADMALLICAGIVFIVAGAAAAARFVARLDASAVRKAVYAVILLAGVYNVVVSAASLA